MIVDLSTLGLSSAALSKRTLSIGGSDANILMSGDLQAILALWERKTGRREPDDLSGVLPVVMGSYTEPLNAAWYERQTGRQIIARGEFMACEHDLWRTATLDGAIEGDADIFDAIWEAKHVNPFGRSEETLAKYQPQLHHNMDVAGVERAILSIFRGNTDWVMFEVERDADYAAAVRKAEWSFWLSVQADEPPVAFDAPPPPSADAMRVVDMTGSNAWASSAADWLMHKDAAKSFDRATKDLKSLVEADVKLATGHGLKVSRSKAGALTIAEMKS